MENHKSIINEIFGLLNKASFMNGATGSVVEYLWIKPAGSSHDYRTSLSAVTWIISIWLNFEMSISRLVTCWVVYLITAHEQLSDYFLAH